jgi:hypothetical protein
MKPDHPSALPRADSFLNIAGLEETTTRTKEYMPSLRQIDGYVVPRLSFKRDIKESGGHINFEAMNLPWRAEPRLPWRANLLASRCASPFPCGRGSAGSVGSPRISLCTDRSDSAGLPHCRSNAARTASIGTSPRRTTAPICCANTK